MLARKRFFLWASLFVAAFFEAVVSSGMCCRGQSCYAATGGDQHWQPPVPLLSLLGTQFPNGTTSVYAVHQIGTCSDIYSTRTAIKYALGACGLVATLYLAGHFSRTLAGFRRLVKAVQTGRGRYLYPKLRATAGTSTQVSMLKYTGTQSTVQDAWWRTARLP